MRLLFLGDIVGRSGREAVLRQAPRLKEELALDALVVNAENAAHGFGLNRRICEELYAAGVDAITTGNHVWDQRELLSTIDDDPRLLRPANFPPGTPGRGATRVGLPDGRQLMVVNVMTRLFMEPLDDPFAAVDQVLSGETLGESVAAILVDVHGEATAEKMAFGHFLDGRVTLVVGTHTHVPTADVMVLPGGTAYQTDAGMCGDYNSVIGMQKESSLHRFRRKIPGERMAPAEGEATVCGVFVEVNDATGQAHRAAPLRVGGRLAKAWPL